MKASGTEISGSPYLSRFPEILSRPVALLIGISRSCFETNSEVICGNLNDLSKFSGRYSSEIFWKGSWRPMFVKQIIETLSYLAWSLRVQCCVHPRHPVLHFEWVNVPGHMVTNEETSSPPLCCSCGLIPNMYLPNYYETGWINLLDVESSPSKYWPMLRLSKNSYLDDSAHELLLIPHTNFEMFDDSAHEYCIHPWWLSVLTEYLSLSLTHKPC